jgi:hypothetical protein
VGSDSNNGTSTSTPWLTIAKVNGSIFKPGDSILFNSGCTWRESLNVPSSGTFSYPITFGAYGNGNKPIIQPTTEVSSWIQVSGNIYSAPLAKAPVAVFINNTYVQQAYWPTKVGASTPVFEYPSSSSSNSTTLTDTNLNSYSSAQLIGTQLNIYVSQYGQRSVTVSGWNSGTNTLTMGTVTYSPTTTMPYYLVAAYGTGIPYSSKSWMMSAGTWFYDYDAGLLYVWQVGGGVPGTVEVANIGNGITINNLSHITVQDLMVRYCGSTIGVAWYYQVGILVEGATHNNIIIQRCDVDYAGYAGISVTDSLNQGLLIDSCTIDHAINGIGASEAAGTVSNNSITNIGGIYPCLPNAGFAINASGDSAGNFPLIISGNTINTSVYMGISSTNPSAIITGNTISNTGLFLSDSGGIYTCCCSAIGTAPQIANNVLTNASVGLYFDSGAANWVASRNTVSGGGLGCKIHQGTTIDVKGNYFTGPFLYLVNQGSAILITDTVGSAHTIAYNIINAGKSYFGINNYTPVASAGINVYNNDIENAVVGLYTGSLSNDFGNVENNIFYNNTTHIHTYSGAFSAINYNLYGGTGNWILGMSTYTTFGNWETASSQDAHSLNANPLFVSTSTPNFQLQSSSPAIGAGTNVGLTTDYVGNPVPSVPDIGAYEFVAPITTSPTDLRLIQ